MFQWIVGGFIVLAVAGTIVSAIAVVRSTRRRQSKRRRDQAGPRIPPASVRFQGLLAGCTRIRPANTTSWSGTLHSGSTRFPIKRPAFPCWRGDADTDVVVIGGGLTGCACAYSIARAGIRDPARGGPDRRRRPPRLRRIRPRGLRRVLPGHGARPRPAQRAFAVAGRTPGLARFRGGAATPAHPLRSRPR